MLEQAAQQPASNGSEMAPRRVSPTAKVTFPSPVLCARSQAVSRTVSERQRTVILTELFRRGLHPHFGHTRLHQSGEESAVVAPYVTDNVA